MCKHLVLVTSIALAFAFTACQAVIPSADSSSAADEIMIADFEWWEEGYRDWEVEGDAFGESPVEGTLPGQMEVTGYLGELLVNSYRGGDGSTGKLTSPPFEIERRYTNFLIGGGGFEGETCINLLIDGKVVRTATGPNTQGGGSEALEWHAWDVSDLAGKDARIEIVDSRAGGWGHINVDHVYQSSTRSSTKVKMREPAERKFTFTKKYLNLPVKNSASERVFSLDVDGKKVREFVMKLAAGEPDFWVYLEVSEFAGKEGILRTDRITSGQMKGFEAVHQADTFPGEESLYTERLRPQFHFNSKRGWNNDPNGMVYHDGEYHLFYQHNPFGWPWGNMTWGHAVSTDLVHWTELGDAIHPDRLGTIFSGSAVIDHDNTTGFQTGDEKPLVCIYTSAGGTNPWSEGQPFTQSLAYSNDRGRTFTVYEGNPVQGHIAGGNRDPKVIWHEPTDQWVIVLFLDEQRLAFFSSKDLKSWKLESEVEPFFECPELFELPVDGDENNKRWVLYGASGDYYVGEFDAKKYIPEGEEPTRYHYGNCFYASQTFTNIPEEDGRRIQIAWGQVDLPGMPFNQMMDFPVELTLHSTEEGIRMFAYPVEEIEKIHGKKHTWKDEVLEPGENLLSGIRGELFDINAEFAVGGAAECGFTIRGVPVTYDVENQRLSCRGENAPLKPVDGKVRLRILVDRVSIEIFGNDGRVYMPMRAILADESKTLEISAKGGDVTLTSLDVYELKSIWGK